MYGKNWWWGCVRCGTGQNKHVADVTMASSRVVAAYSAAAAAAAAASAWVREAAGWLRAASAFEAASTRKNKR